MNTNLGRQIRSLALADSLRLRIWERTDPMMIKLPPLSAKLAKFPPSCNGFHILGEQLAAPLRSCLYMLLPSIYLSVCLSACLSVCLPACLSVCLPVCLSVCHCLSVYLSINYLNLSACICTICSHQSNRQLHGNMHSLYLYHQARFLKNPEPEAYPPVGRKCIQTTLQKSKTAWNNAKQFPCRYSKARHASTRYAHYTHTHTKLKPPVLHGTPVSYTWESWVKEITGGKSLEQSLRAYPPPPIKRPCQPLCRRSSAGQWRRNSRCTDSMAAQLRIKARRLHWWRAETEFCEISKDEILEAKGKGMKISWARRDAYWENMWRDLLSVIFLADTLAAAYHDIVARLHHNQSTALPLT